MESIIYSVLLAVGLLSVLISAIWSVLFFVVGVGFLANLFVKYISKRPAWKNLSILSLVFCLVGFCYSMCSMEFVVCTPEVIYVGPALP